MPDPGETYYREHGWSGCTGAAWDRLPDGVRDVPERLRPLRRLVGARRLPHPSRRRLNTPITARCRHTPPVRRTVVTPRGTQPHQPARSST